MVKNVQNFKYEFKHECNVKYKLAIKIQKYNI